LIEHSIVFGLGREIIDHVLLLLLLLAAC